MTKKNGFTLIELIITIGIMVLMGIIIANNLTSLFSRREDENISDFEKTLEEAACIYIDLSDPEIKEKKTTCKTEGCSVNVGVLIENGLLDENLQNPLTKRKIKDDKLDRITITYPDGEKTCTYEAE